MLELSLREALALKHNYIGTEHILLGLVREGEGLAMLVLTASAPAPRWSAPASSTPYAPPAEPPASGSSCRRTVLIAVQRVEQGAGWTPSGRWGGRWTATLPPRAAGRRYQAHVWRFLRHLLGDAALAEDVTQETLCFSPSAAADLRGRSVLRLGVPDRPQRRSGRPACGQAPGPRAAARTTAAGASARHATVEAMAAVASLSPKLREALLLVEVFGFTYREAAEVLRVPDGTEEPGLPREGPSDGLAATRKVGPVS